MSENQDELKAQIKVWLKQQKMTREEFAAECFVSPNTVRNWLARVSIPKDKEALIRLMMEKTEREKELKEAARAHWKPSAVMVNTDDYKLIEKAARKDNMTVEEWAEGILIRDAQERMEHVYPDAGQNGFIRKAAGHSRKIGDMPPEVNSADDSATFPAESTAFRTFPPTFSVCGPSFSGTAWPGTRPR